MYTIISVVRCIECKEENRNLLIGNRISHCRCASARNVKSPLFLDGLHLFRLGSETSVDEGLASAKPFPLQDNTNDAEAASMSSDVRHDLNLTTCLCDATDFQFMGRRMLGRSENNTL
jgi:hypothetical protein